MPLTIKTPSKVIKQGKKKEGHKRTETPSSLWPTLILYHAADSRGNCCTFERTQWISVVHIGIHFDRDRLRFCKGASHLRFFQPLLVCSFLVGPMQAYPQVSNTFHNKKCKNSKHRKTAKLLFMSFTLAARVHDGPDQRLVRTWASRCHASNDEPFLMGKSPRDESFQSLSEREIRS